MNRTFDRLVSFDERSRAYPIRAAVTAQTPRSFTWRCDKLLDQGREGACTGFAVAHDAAGRPAEVRDVTNQIARDVYHRARQLDDFDGEDYEGSSVLGAIKAGKERGWYGEYRWAFGEADLALAIGHCGPAILGINWYEGMGNPDATGRVSVTGRVLGGHAILCNGYNHKRREYRLHNSWGSSWGRGGECVISAADMARLLSEQGEACIPTKRLKGMK